MKPRPRAHWIIRLTAATLFIASPFISAHAAAQTTAAHPAANSPAHSARPTAHATTHATAHPAAHTASSASETAAHSRTAARRARLARARAAAAARAHLAAVRQREAERAESRRGGSLAPQIRAAAAIIFNPATGAVLWEEHSREQRSIASLTKLMTAEVFLADDPDLTRIVDVTKPDVTNASVTHLRAGDQIELGELLHLMLIASDNGAARVLARTSDGSTDAFVQRMNDMAQQLQLNDTHYADPTGLDADNVSTAYDISHLISFATSDDRIGSIMRLATYDVHTTTRVIPIHSTDRLLGTNVDVLGGKTGFINKAGYCFATLLQIPQGSQIAVVVLGAASSSTRFWDARNLFNWAVAGAPAMVGATAAAAAVKR